MEDNAAIEPRALVDHENGTVSPSIFVEHDIYKREVEQIFARCWLYLCHESQVTQPGDFTQGRMGEDGILVCRGPSGELHAFLNMCPTCSSLLQRADSGRAGEFTCSYHGWDFNLDGLVLAEDESGKKVPVDDLTLIPVPQMDSYKGMIFATFDEKAVPLPEFLGDIRWGLDLLLEQGVMKVGSVTRWQVDCNWKFAAESSVNDINHGTVHLGALHADRSIDLERELSMERDGFTVITEFGHGLNAEAMDEGLANADDPIQQWRQDSAKQRRLGQFRMNVNRCVVTLCP